MHSCSDKYSCGHPCCRCPLSARLDAPTPLPPPGPATLLIGGGCLCRCHSRRHRPPCGRPWGPEEDRRRRSPGPYPRIDLSCFGGARAETRSLEKRPATGRWRTSTRSGADGLRPAEDAAEGSGAKGGQNPARYGRVGFADGTWRGFYWVSAETAHLFSCQWCRDCAWLISAWGDAAASHFSDRPGW
jgi:hypothetical protein